MNESQYSCVDRTGDFRGKIYDYRAIEGKGGSMNIAVKVFITGWWNPEQAAWDDTWEQYAMEATGILNVVKNDKSLNDLQVRALTENAGWDGRMMSIFENTWDPTPIAFSVVENTYKGYTDLRIGFINPYDGVPGARGISEEKAKAFDSTYGSQLRALAGNVGRNAPVASPSGKPAAPAKSTSKAPKPAARATASQAKGASVELPQVMPADDIPFSFAWVAILLPMLSQLFG